MSAGVMQAIKKSIDTAREAGNQRRYYRERVKEKARAIY